MKGNAPSFHMGNQLPLEAILQSITPASGTTPPIVHSPIYNGLPSSVRTAPDETIKDKIFFVFNNVSKQNMDIKANELRSILHSEDWPYLAQHLVINRASIEPNFHTLYLEFLDYLKIPGLLELVLNSTYAGTSRFASCCSSSCKAFLLNLCPSSDPSAVAVTAHHGEPSGEDLAQEFGLLAG
jgi:hypothetical protein